MLFLFCYSWYGVGLLFAKQVIFGSLMIVLTVTDWRERLLPDRVNFPGMAMGLLFSVALPVGDGAGRWLAGWAGIQVPPVPVGSLLDALLGALVGGGLLYLLGEAYFRLRHREGMGLGDVKMMALVGCFLGPRLALLTILLGSLGGSVLGLLFILVFRKDSSYELPFGSFLGVAAFFSAVWGWPILSWYRGFFP